MIKPHNDREIQEAVIRIDNVVQAINDKMDAGEIGIRWGHRKIGELIAYKRVYTKTGKQVILGRIDHIEKAFFDQSKKK